MSQDMLDKYSELVKQFADDQKREKAATALGIKHEPANWGLEDHQAIEELMTHCIRYISSLRMLMLRLGLLSINRTEPLFTKVWIPSTPSTLQLEWPCVFPRYLGLPWTARPDLASQNYTIRNDRTLHNHHGKWLAAHWLDDPRMPGRQMLDLECYNMGHCAVYSEDEHLSLHPIWMFFVRVFVNETILGMAQDKKPHRKYVHYPVGNKNIDEQTQVIFNELILRTPGKNKTNGVIGFEINAADLQVALTLQAFLLSCEVTYFERYRKQFTWSHEEQAALNSTLLSLMAYADTKRASEVRAKALARPNWHQRIYRHMPVGGEVDLLDV